MFKCWDNYVMLQGEKWLFQPLQLCFRFLCLNIKREVLVIQKLIINCGIVSNIKMKSN